VSGHRIGVLGGTFDPLHVGHLFIAEAVAAEAGLADVLFSPVGSPAHRSPHAPAHDRSAMVALGIEGNARFRLDDTALRQSGAVYTADTLPLLQARYPQATLSFIAGIDSLVNSVWQRLDQVAKLLERFYVVARDGLDAGGLDECLAALPLELKQRFVLLNLPLVDVSASSIRARVRQAKPIRYLVPNAVENYIREHGLYQAAP
jgi:nicotinate-nucleotide adenylyltransferase